MVRTRPVLLLGLLGALLASAAQADEIVYRDPDTCAETQLRGVEVTSEGWTEIRYKDDGRTEKSLPAPLVLDIRREDKSAQTRDLKSAIEELQRGNVSEARARLRVLSGGGYVQDLETGQRKFRGFAENDPTGRGKRPSWQSEYAHFYYVKALVEEGVAKKDEELLQEALLALDDQPIPGAEAKDGKVPRTGGFLGRFDGGNSRFYPEAMLLKARALLALGKSKEALAAYKDLDDKAALDIGPRWAFEAKMGPARVAEAQGRYLDAINASKDAATTMVLMIKEEVRGCLRRELGRYYSRARMLEARIRLQQAEQNRSAAEYRQLRDFINESSPEALKRTFGTLPEDQRDALVAGAMDPNVQAVFQNALGFAALQERRYDEAILAFRGVEVKYFAEPEEHARALHYLAQAADGAAQQARNPSEKKLYETYRDRARERLQQEHPRSEWAGGK